MTRLTPILPFSGPILFDESAVCDICRYARDGYQTKFKRETFGFLFGTLTSRHRLRVRRAVYYRGGRKTRTGVVFKDMATVMRGVRRRRQLALARRLRVLGSFHSHVEIGGTVFRGLSQDDRESFVRDPEGAIEAIVFVWPGSNKILPSQAGTIVAYDPRCRLNFRLRVYAKRRNGIRMVCARVVPSDIVIVF
uniref:JAB domain-containing protein n=1 Tax=candidate division WOR-3 bacterium TaxID=2052148 RepID=A0A7C4CBQ8_UNCW3